MYISHLYNFIVYQHCKKGRVERVEPSVDRPTEASIKQTFWPGLYLFKSFTPDLVDEDIN